MDTEYTEVTKMMKSQIKLSPYNPKKELTLRIDGASLVGTGFVLLQRVKEVASRILTSDVIWMQRGFVSD